MTAPRSDAEVLADVVAAELGLPSDVVEMMRPPLTPESLQSIADVVEMMGEEHQLEALRRSDGCIASSNDGKHRAARSGCRRSPKRLPLVRSWIGKLK